MSQNPNHHHYSVNNLQIELQDIGSAVATPKSSATERKLRNEIWKKMYLLEWIPWKMVPWNLYATTEKNPAVEKVGHFRPTFSVVVFLCRITSIDFIKGIPRNSLKINY